MASLILIGHEASLTGAPYTQLYLMQWLRNNTSHTIELILIEGGPLVPEFEKVATVYILRKFSVYPSLGQRFLRKIDAMLGWHQRAIYSRVIKTNPQLIIANSILSLSFAVEVKEQLQIPLLLHLHELESPFFHISKEIYIQNAQSVDFFIACSEAVRKYHQELCKLPKQRITTIYSFFGPRPYDDSTAAEVRTEFGIPADASLIGAVGSQGWGKGTDWFLRVAQELLANPTKPIYFMWLGGNASSRDYKEFQYDLNLLGLDKQILCVTSRKHIRGFYQAFDVLLLTSRIDSFPLVCLEAAMQGCPTICFAQAGGMPEFVREDAGFVVPYGDTSAMTAKISYLLTHDDERQHMGQVGRRRVAEQHTIEVAGPQFQKVIQQFIHSE